MKQDVASEVRNKDYIGFVVESSEAVSHPALQIIKRSDIEGIMKGYQSLQNGKVKIIYDISPYSSLDRIMNSVDSFSFVGLILDVISVFHEIKYNTVLPIDTIVLNTYNIFVDQKKCKVKLLLLPVKSQASIRERELYEKKVIYTLSTLMYQSRHIMDTHCRALYDDCQSEKLLLDDLYNNMQTGKYGEHYVRYNAANNHLMATLEPFQKTEIRINIFKEKTVIGKSRIGTDARIDRQGVSRRHCEIIYKDGKFFLQDLGSTNGTAVNNVRLFAGQYVPLKMNDVIDISDVRYKLILY